MSAPSPRPLLFAASGSSPPTAGWLVPSVPASASRLGPGSPLWSRPPAPVPRAVPALGPFASRALSPDIPRRTLADSTRTAT